MQNSRYAIKAVSFLILFFIYGAANAQEKRQISLNEAVQLGIENSKQLKLSRAKVDEAITQYEQAKDAALPTGKVSYAYNHAEIPENKLTAGPTTIELPKRADAWLGTFSLQQLIFAGNKLKYAKESTDLLTKVALLDVDRDKDDIVYNVINAYYNLYKVQQSRKVVDQNLQAIDKQIKQSQRFFEQGIVTKNDVLRFQLQRSNIEITGMDLDANRKIINYNLNVLLGLPENTQLEATQVAAGANQSVALNNLIDSALTNRSELKAYDLRGEVADKNIKSVKANMLPTFGVGVSAYYLNAGSLFIPPAERFITPISAAASLSWNFDQLWTNKNKVAEARIQKTQLAIGKDLTVDRVKTDVNQSFQNYLNAVDKIKVLQTAVDQARENDKILESKYQNNIASATDRVDAESQLFLQLINIELAKADAGLAYYSLIKSTGTITNINF
ncbi:TolC family protein [Pedobacter sp. HMF7647]|uniref:TolC family protein n=2 Tax=Hufsiella arboris TaxID=2695275 RepID=A0A7K1Y4W8_9SPHI|nr:TolC family protein [Hufsiella arboris]